MGILLTLVLIAGIITGYYWYKLVDLPREKMFKQHKEKGDTLNGVIINGMDNSSEGGIDGN